MFDKTQHHKTLRSFKTSNSNGLLFHFICRTNILFEASRWVGSSVWEPNIYHKIFLERSPIIFEVFVLMSLSGHSIHFVYRKRWRTLKFGCRQWHSTVFFRCSIFSFRNWCILEMREYYFRTFNFGWRRRYGCGFGRTHAPSTSTPCLAIPEASFHIIVILFVACTVSFYGDFEEPLSFVVSSLFNETVEKSSFAS